MHGMLGGFRFLVMLGVLEGLSGPRECLESIGRDGDINFATRNVRFGRFWTRLVIFSETFCRDSYYEDYWDALETC